MNIGDLELDSEDLGVKTLGEWKGSLKGKGSQSRNLSLNFTMMAPSHVISSSKI